MASILGDMDTIATKPAPIKSRKRKPEPVYEQGGSSPLSRSSYRTNGGYGSADPDMSSDGPLDDGTGFSSGDDAFMSPKKKLKTETPGITPAIERMGKLDVESGTDTDFSNLDMDAFMDVDDDEEPKPKKKPASRAKVSCHMIPSSSYHT